MSSKKQKVVIILNGFKYLFVWAAFLFMSVFGLTKCGGGALPMETEAETGADTGTSLTYGTTEDSSSNITVNSDDYTTYGSETSETSSTATVDPDGADHTWAMFLVNEKNPIPRSYDDYVDLELVDETYKPHYLDRRCARFYKKMLDAAKEDGIELITSSAYRSYEYQKENFENSMKTRMDSGMTEEEAYADTLIQVQLPGHSEHNVGLAVDILSNEYTGMDDSGFENTKAFEWLSKHASEYGFILRYPKGKQDITGIIYEPWHYRFVGLYYAKEVENSGLCLEEYFMKMGWADTDGVVVQNTVYDRNPALARVETTMPITAPASVTAAEGDEKPTEEEILDRSGDEGSEIE